VDAFTHETVGTQLLGRRTAPRSQHTIEEKLRIVRQTHVRGASVATPRRALITAAPLQIARKAGRETSSSFWRN
jgi:transposase-like protein